jgi:hypothetical protein
MRNRYSSVAVTRGCRLDEEVSIPDRGKRFSPLLDSAQTASEADPASYTTGTEGFIPGSEADHSHPSNPEVKNGGSIPTLPYKSS